MSKNQVRFADVAAEIRRLRESDEVQLALQEKAMLENARQELDKLQSLYDRGRELMEEGIDGDELLRMLED